MANVITYLSPDHHFYNTQKKNKHMHWAKGKSEGGRLFEVADISQINTHPLTKTPPLKFPILNENPGYLLKNLQEFTKL